jgi:hypothetical protein
LRAQAGSKEKSPRSRTSFAAIPLTEQLSLAIDHPTDQNAMVNLM